MAVLNEWLVFSLILFVIWFIIFIFNRRVRNEMLIVSLFTMPFGLTEPLFVPEYWSPPSLFNLAVNTGFDIESLIFSFAIGGIGSVIYESVFKVRHKKIDYSKLKPFRYRLHLLVIISSLPVFLALLFFTSLNSIYSTSIAMFIGALSTVICRPDLKKKIFVGGLLFLGLYFLFFSFFNLIYPYAIERYWNLSVISGILILGVPLEELIFAFTFGLMWSSIYEHVKGYKI